MFTVAGGGGGGASGQNTGHGFVTLADWDERKGKREHRRRDRRSAPRRAFRGLRDAQVFALVPARDPRPRPVDRLHDGAAEHRRPEPRRSSPRRATSCSPPRAPIPTLASVRLSELPDVADAQGRHRPAEARRARPHPGRRQHARSRPPGAAATSTTSSTAAGSSASMSRATRRTAPQPERPRRNGTSAASSGADGALLLLRARLSWSTAPTTLSRFNGISVLRDFRARPRRARARARRWTRIDEARRPDSRASASPGPACPIRSGCRRARRRSSTPCRCSSSSCASPRCTKAGRSRSRCCWSSRSAWSARSSR